MSNFFLGDDNMPAYTYMDSKTSIHKNPLWFRKYWFKKQSRMRYRSRYSNRYISHNLLEGYGIHSSY